MTLSVVNGALHLRFPAFDAGLVDRVRAIPCAAWSKVHGCWTFPLTATAYGIVVREFGVRCPEMEVALKPVRAKEKDLKFKTRPFRHRVEAVRFLLGRFGVEVEK